MFDHNHNHYDKEHEMTTYVRYILGPKAVDPGVKGVFAAPTDDIEQAIAMTKAQLMDNAHTDGVPVGTSPADLFTIVKAEVQA